MATKMLLGNRARSKPPGSQDSSPRAFHTTPAGYVARPGLHDRSAEGFEVTGTDPARGGYG